jgi:hypothetical protein
MQVACSPIFVYRLSRVTLVTVILFLWGTLSTQSTAA